MDGERLAGWEGEVVVTQADELHRDFCCAVCQRRVNNRWNRPGRDQEIAPVCRYCEGWHTLGVGKPSQGSIRDRREVMRVYALADALYSAAMQIKWRSEYATT